MMNKTTQSRHQQPRKLGRLLKKETGASAIEYAIIASLIALAITAGAGLLGGGINQAFTDIAEELGVEIPN